MLEISTSKRAPLSPVNVKVLVSPKWLMSVGLKLKLVILVKKINDSEIYLQPYYLI